MDITDVLVHRVTEDRGQHGRLLAFAKITIADEFVVDELRVIAGDRGPFIAMPARKICDHCRRCGAPNALRARYCGQCGTTLDPDRYLRDADGMPILTPDGRPKTHCDLAFPIRDACRLTIHHAILTAYATTPPPHPDRPGST